MHCIQPLLPVLADAFHVSAAESSLAMSVTTGILGPAILTAGMISDRVGRVGILIGSLAVSGVLTLAVAVASTWESLLVFRFLSGLSLAGLSAVGVAFIAEEVEPEAVPRVIGLYIGGSAIGGMSGRVAAGALTDLLGWRPAVGGIAVLTLIAAVVFWRIVPPSRNFVPRSIHPRRIATGIRDVFRDRQLPWLYAEGALLMGAFFAVYNYIAFRLLAPPYNLSHTEVGSIFILYILGSVCSSVAGHIAKRFGPSPTFLTFIGLALAGVALTLAPLLWIVIAGIGLLTVGFFGAHAIASGSVAGRKASYPAVSSGLYFLAFYLGASIFGTLGGFAWAHGGWTGVGSFAAAILAVALAVGLRLRSIGNA
jgi:YNFM family putative membrane transporter